MRSGRNSISTSENKLLLLVWVITERKDTEMRERGEATLRLLIGRVRTERC